MEPSYAYIYIYITKYLNAIFYTCMYKYTGFTSSVRFCVRPSLLILSAATFKMIVWRAYWIFQFPDSKFSLAYSAPIHYLNHCHWTLWNKLQWNFNQNSNIFIQENAFEHVVCGRRPFCSKGDELMYLWDEICHCVHRLHKFWWTRRPSPAYAFGECRPETQNLLHACDQ